MHLLKSSLPKYCIRFIQNRQLVTTWTPLAIAFNTAPSKKFNFARNEVGIFGLEELRTPKGFFLLKENVTNKTDDLIKEATSVNRNRKIAQIFDEMSDSLCKVADLAEFIRIAHPSSKYAQAAEDVCINISGIVEYLNTHKELYNALCGVVKSGDITRTTAIDDHVAKLFLFDFEQSGIHLKEEERKRVIRLNDYILQTGQKFMNGTALPTVYPRNQIPESVRNFFPNEGDHILVSGLFTNFGNAQARELAYKIYLFPSEKQEELLIDLLKCRHSLARTCGFDTYAQRALNGSTVETPEMVHDIMNELNEDLRLRAEKDYSIMRKMKRQESGSNAANDGTLEPWDLPYYTSLKKREALKTNAKEFLPYFSLGGCMEGLDHLMQSLYGITLKNTPMQPGESWHHTIYKLSVIHDQEGLLGYIYCDFFERENKPNQDCHFTIQGGKLMADGTYQLPIVVVMLSLAQARWNSPTLLSPSKIDNLFHEMGHAMHSMLARTEYQHITGTRCSTDFAEVPSVLMEYFASDPRVLKTFARHYKTNEPMADEMLERSCITKHLFSASDTQLQLFYSALDQMYHGDPQKYNSNNTTNILKLAQERYYSLPYVENTAWQHRFSHLVGYGAKYYAYLISRAIASWIWQTYFEKDPFDRDAGEKYRREVLAHGGGLPPRQLVSNFLKRDVTAKALAESLIHEIDRNNEKIEHLFQT